MPNNTPLNLTEANAQLSGWLTLLKQTKDVAHCETQTKVINQYIFQAIHTFPHLAHAIHITTEPVDTLRCVRGSNTTTPPDILLAALQQNLRQEFNQTLSNVFVVPLPYAYQNTISSTIHLNNHQGKSNTAFLDIEIKKNPLPGMGENISIPISQIESIVFSDQAVFTPKLPPDYDSVEFSGLYQEPNYVMNYFSFRGFTRFDRELPCLAPDLTDPYLFQLKRGLWGPWLYRGFLAPISHPFEAGTMYELRFRTAHARRLLIERDLPRWFNQGQRNHRVHIYHGNDIILRLMQFPLYHR